MASKKENIAKVSLYNNSKSQFSSIDFKTKEQKRHHNLKKKVDSSWREFTKPKSKSKVRRVASQDIKQPFTNNMNLNQNQNLNRGSSNNPVKRFYLNKNRSQKDIYIPKDKNKSQMVYRQYSTTSLTNIPAPKIEQDNEDSENKKNSQNISRKKVKRKAALVAYNTYFKSLSNIKKKLDVKSKKLVRICPNYEEVKFLSTYKEKSEESISKPYRLINSHNFSNKQGVSLTLYVECIKRP